MNRFEKLLKKFTNKMRVYHSLCPNINYVRAEKAYEDLVTLVAALRNHELKMDPYTARHIAAEAEEMIGIISKMERDERARIAQIKARVNFTLAPRPSGVVRRPNKMRARLKSRQHREFVESHNIIRTA